MSYKRADAVSFADRFWNIPADDGVFWLSDVEVDIHQVRLRNVLKSASWKAAPASEGWQPIFVSDGLGGEKAIFRRTVGAKTEEILINGWAGIADCAHFLSRCITAGGIKIAQLSVPVLIKELQARQDTKTLCAKVSKEAGQRVVNSGVLKPGDMIGYFNVDPKGDYGGAKEYSHSTMYAGKINGKTDGGVTCHTICRFPGRSSVEDSWWLKPPGHYSYTFIHFSSDDAVPDPALAKRLAGWWKLEYLGRTEYYLIHPSGSVQYTKRAPAKAASSIQAPEGAAYWFTMPSGEITFIWRLTGTVEVWTSISGGFQSKINSTTPGVLTKLF